MPVPRTPSHAGVRYGVPVTVRVPATTANLGPGFDSLGLALDVHDHVTVEALPPASPADGPDGGLDGGARPSVVVTVEGEGAGAVPLTEDHLVVRSVRAGLAHVGAGRPDLRLTCRNAIPHGRGLGSSASAIVAGLVAARGLLQQPQLLDDETVLDLATAAEGHPDNASAALLGGFTLSWTEGHRARSVRLPVDPRVTVVACVPDGELATSRARAMLPPLVPHGDAAFTAGRAALLVEAMTRRPDLLQAATEERLHQAQRAPAMPSSAALLAAVRGAGAAAVVSGAGPTVLVLGCGEQPYTVVTSVLAGAGADIGGTWDVLRLQVDTDGAEIVTESADRST